MKHVRAEAQPNYLSSSSCSHSYAEEGMLISKCLQCIGLRKLTITLKHRRTSNKPRARAASVDLVRLSGLMDLLEVRDIVKMEIIVTETFS